MVSEKLFDLMNNAIAREIQVAIQYMWQHVMWRGIKGFAIKDELEKIAVEEMKHAEAIAERLVYLGGSPTTKPDPIHVGESLKEMFEQDKKDEESAITLYKRIIVQASEENDVTTARLFRKILMDEEEHHDFFTSILEDL